MPSSSGQHPLTYPLEEATNWYVTFQSYTQQVSDYLDNLDSTILSEITDISGNPFFTFTAATSAVNYIDVRNASLTNAPRLMSTGDGTDIDLELATKGSGLIILNDVSWPKGDGATNYIVMTDGAGTLSWEFNAKTLIEDLTPQLGGDLDVNGNSITSTGSNHVILDSANDIILELGDQIGSNQLILRTFEQTNLWTIDSNGQGTGIALTLTSGLTITTNASLTVDGTASFAAIDIDDLDIAGADTESTLESDDLIIFEDTSAGEAKAITFANLQNAIVDSSIIRARVVFAYNSSTPTEIIVFESLNVDSVTRVAAGGGGSTVFKFDISTGTFKNHFVSALHLPFGVDDDPTGPTYVPLSWQQYNDTFNNTGSETTRQCIAVTPYPATTTPASDYPTTATTVHVLTTVSLPLSGYEDPVFVALVFIGEAPE